MANFLSSSFPQFCYLRVNVMLYAPLSTFGFSLLWKRWQYCTRISVKKEKMIDGRIREITESCSRISHLSGRMKNDGKKYIARESKILVMKIGNQPQEWKKGVKSIQGQYFSFLASVRLANIVSGRWKVEKLCFAPETNRENESIDKTGALAQT